MNTQKIDVVILCGGQGKRLRKVISDRPKSMIMINRRPFLDILIDYVASFGFRRFILCIGYMGNIIKQYYQKKRSSLMILFSEEKEPLGTGGTIKNAKPLIRSNPFLVINGDSFCQVDFCQFIDFHIGKEALLSIVLVKAEKTKDYGVIALDDSQRIVKFDEKASVEDNNRFISAGIYLFHTGVLSLMPLHKNFSLEYDLFPKIVDRKFYSVKKGPVPKGRVKPRAPSEFSNRVYGYVSQGTFVDIGTPERYKKAKQLLNNCLIAK